MTTAPFFMAQYVRVDSMLAAITGGLFVLGIFLYEGRSMLG
jgi:hypothetical protein